MRIAIAGKGGTGKTTIAGTLARALARAGRSVLAIDADTTPNLATTIGVAPERARDMVGLPTNLLERRTHEDGSTSVVFAADTETLIAEHGVVGPDGVRLMVMGKVGHGGAGWMCRAHATVRGFIGELVARADDRRDLIVDMEAGLEHFSRGTGRHVTRFLATVEPYYRSMETARRVAELAAELGITDVVAVANKVRNAEDRSAVEEFCAAHNLTIVGTIPYDTTLIDAERAGRPPIDYAPDAPAASAIRALADTLLRTSA